MLLIGLGICVFFHFRTQSEETAEFDDFLESNERLQSQVVTEIEQDSIIEEEQNFDIDITVDFGQLSEINSDIIAWLYIPDTYISFPILQERVLMEYYYLNHDYMGERLSAGSIFTPAEPLGIDDAHFLLFGHNTKRSDVAFSGLYELYSTLDLGRNNSYIYILYPDKIERWELWCAVEGHSEDAVYEIPYQLGTDGYMSLIEDISNKSSYQNGIMPSNEERITVLSTCNGAVGGTERFYVVFRLESEVMMQNE